MMRAFLEAAAWLCAFALSGCLESSDRGGELQGPGSETVGLKGEAAYLHGRPADRAKVIARPASWLADTSERAPHVLPGGETLADSKGRFVIAPLPVDSYFVEIRGDSGRAALLTVPVVVGKLSVAPKAVLKPVGGIIGKITRLRASQASVFLRVQGLDRVVYVAPESTSFRIPDLPEGTYVLQAMSPDPVLGALVVPRVAVRSGEVKDVGALVLDAFINETYADWSHSRGVAVRTGVAGADVDADVTGFPLLLRLDAGNFPFDTSSSPVGADLRFMSASGRHLPYEIESWDPAAQKAQVWVRLDTVKAGDDAQAIRMLWGNRFAPSLSSGESVFGSADGYRGAWHMRRDPVLGGYPDAGSRGNTAVTVIPEAVTEALSPLLTCARLDGKRGVLASRDSLAGPQIFTLSMWIKADGPGKLIGFESFPDMAKGYDAARTTTYDRHLWIEPDGSLHFGVYIADPPASSMDNERILVHASGLIDGKWHHIAGTQDPVAGMALYLDGKRVAANPDVPHAEAIGGYWILGGGTLREWSPPLKDNTHFQGDLDEARVVDALHSAAWIKLAFETQKEGSTVASILPP